MWEVKNAVVIMTKSKEITTTEKIDNFKMELNKNYSKELTNFFWGNEKEKLKFLSWIIYSISKIPALLNDPASLMNAVLDLAPIGLTPWIWGEAYILPFKWKATALIGYQGYVKLLYQAWVASVYAEIVRENDIFKSIAWTEARIIHEIDPKYTLEKRWVPIWAYVVVKINWEKIHKYMSKDEIFRFRDFSQSYKDSLVKWHKNSPWYEEKDPEFHMWKKTVLKQIIKYLPKNEQLNNAFEVDNKEAPVGRNREEVITWWPGEMEKLENAFNNLDNKKITNE